MLTFDVDAEVPAAPRVVPPSISIPTRDAGPVGVTVVLTSGRRGFLVTCTCGALTGRRRLLRGGAVAEAYMHAAAGNCIPAQPLIDPHMVFANATRRH